LETNFIAKTILIAPLDWGLGHASRCIPIIKYLQKRNCKIVIATSGEQLSLLNNEFPGLEYVPLKGYNVNYSKHKRWFGAKILLQSPKILLRIKQENRYLQGIIDKHKIDIVISDNRYGLYTKKVPCVFITHQLSIKANYIWLENIIQKINYRFINRFMECWVPDFEGKKNIAGELSHPKKMPLIPVKYIGPLSRFQGIGSNEIAYKYLFVLSGPEPQRSILEQTVLDVATKLTARILIVRGKPAEEKQEIISETYNICNHLTTDEMQIAFLQSEYIISRTGYTTVMELLSLQKKSILIPTPGQTEQEYLAAHVMQQNWCYCCDQNDDLLYHIQQAETFNYQLPKPAEPMYEKAIDELLKTL
jgi:uncharacterized protein (TIGR00661 family)